MQAHLANTFHSHLLPLRELIDNVKTDVLDSVHQQMISVFSEYRFATQNTIQIDQLSQTDSAAGFVSFGGDISGDFVHC